MTDTQPPSTEEPTPAVKPPAKKPRAAQDQATANLITACRTSLTSARNNLDFIALSGSRGYGAPGLAEGLKACDLAQEKFNAREIAMDTKRIASKVLKSADAAARSGYADFCRIASKVFVDNANARAALVIPVRDLQDLQKFVTDVTAAYNTALARTTYMTALSKRGYTPDAVQAELAKLAALTEASAAFDAAVTEATRATADRNAAVKALKAWWAEFYAVSQVSLKDRPDLLKLLKA